MPRRGGGKSSFYGHFELALLEGLLKLSTANATRSQNLQALVRCCKGQHCALHANPARSSVHDWNTAREFTHHMVRVRWTCAPKTIGRRCSQRHLQCP